MSDPAAISDADLHALADGRLDPARRESVEAWLAAHPEDAARVAFYKRLNGELHRAFDPVLEAAVPDELARRPSHVWLRRAVRGAAAACLLAAAVSAGWAANDLWGVPERVVEVPAPMPTLSQQAALAHNVYTVEVRHPVEVPADDATHLVTWLSRRMGHQLKIPKLDTAGFQFMGGRLLPSRAGGVASQLMYENPNGLRVTLFVRPVDGEPAGTSLRYATENKVGVFYWVDDRLGYALTGSVERQQLYKLAHVVWEQINN